MLFCLPSFAFFRPLAALAQRLAGAGLWGLTLLASLFLANAEASAAAPTESARVASVIQDYLDGSSYNRREQLRRAFHADARLYLNGKDGAMREVGIEEYAAWFSKSPGQFNGRVGRLLNVQVDGGIASAKVSVIPNAVDLGDFAVAGTADQALAASLGLDGKTVLGFIGSFYSYEGLALLLQALPALLRARPDIRVLLVGGGPQEQALKAQARELGLAGQVVFTGRVPHELGKRCWTPNYLPILGKTLWAKQPSFLLVVMPTLRG